MVMGNTTIHDDVFREIVRIVLEEVEGVYFEEGKKALAPFWGDKATKPTITIKWPTPDTESREQVSLEVRIAAHYGAAIPQMVSAIRRESIARIQAITGYEVLAVDVYITKLVRLENERRAERP